MIAPTCSKLTCFHDMLSMVASIRMLGVIFPAIYRGLIAVRMVGGEQGAFLIDRISLLIRKCLFTKRTTLTCDM